MLSAILPRPIVESGMFEQRQSGRDFLFVRMRELFSKLYPRDILSCILFPWWSCPCQLCAKLFGLIPVKGQRNRSIHVFLYAVNFALRSLGKIMTHTMIKSCCRLWSFDLLLILISDWVWQGCQQLVLSSIFGESEIVREASYPYHEFIFMEIATTVFSFQCIF